jgi:hypothetical protein
MTDTAALIRDWMEAEGVADPFYDAKATACTLPIGGGSELSVFGIPESEDVFVAIDVLRVGRNSVRSELFALCMSMNAYAARTRGGTLGFDADRDKLVLTYRIAAPLIDRDILSRIIANLTDTATGIRRSLNDLVQRRDEAFHIETDRDDPVWFKG